jgi:hypothetical protein
MDKVALQRRILDLETRLNEKEDPVLRAEYNQALEAGEDRYGWDDMMDFYRRVSISRRMWWPESVTDTHH